MPTTTEIAAAATQFVTASNKAFAIVNGPAEGASSLIATESGDLKSHARLQFEFSNASAEAISDFGSAGDTAIFNFNAAGATAIDTIEAAAAAISGELLAALLATFGLTAYANLAAANTALEIGSLFFNMDTNKLAITTA